MNPRIPVRPLTVSVILFASASLTACNPLTINTKQQASPKDVNFVTEAEKKAQSSNAQEYEKLAREAYQKGDYLNSSKYLKQQLDLVQKRYNELVPVLSRLYFNLGLSSLKQGQNEAAITYLETGLPLATATFGKNHKLVARYYSNLGTSHIRQKHYKASIQPLQSSVAIKKNLYGEKTSQLLPDYRRLHKAYKKLNSTEYTKIYRQKIREIEMLLSKTDNH